MAEMVRADAVFLDRDGTINEEVNYASNPKDLRLVPGAARAIRSLNERGIPVVVITNQGGIARGYHTEADVETFHKALSKELKKDGAHIDKFYFCPHHPAGKGEYGIECACRKPQPELLHRAAHDLGLDLTTCVMIGDKSTDIGAAEAVGADSVLVMTGHGQGEWEAWKESFKPTHTAKDIAEAVKWILKRREA